MPPMPVSPVMAAPLRARKSCSSWAAGSSRPVKSAGGRRELVEGGEYLFFGQEIDDVVISHNHMAAHIPADPDLPHRIAVVICLGILFVLGLVCHAVTCP
jgi:hypothetical protein